MKYAGIGTRKRRRTYFATLWTLRRVCEMEASWGIVEPKERHQIIKFDLPGTLRSKEGRVRSEIARNEKEGSGKNEAFFLALE